MTAASPLRVLLLAQRPVQYAPAAWRALAAHPDIELTVGVLDLGAVAATHDPEFDTTVAWDVPLLDGYPWVLVDAGGAAPVGPEGAPTPRQRLDALLDPARCDAVVLMTGYKHRVFWRAWWLARRRGLAVLSGTDAHDTTARNGAAWKAALKRRLWPRLFGALDAVYAPSTATRALMLDLGLDPARVVLAPFVVDNEAWLARAAVADPAALRRDCGIPPGAPVALFCAKLQPWKRPRNLVAALAHARTPDLHVVFAGTGPEAAAIGHDAAAAGLGDRVHELGFVNQSRLAEVYVGADLLVLPSAYEPFGLVVNEAMLCGRPAIVSDRVGAAADLVRPGATGWIVPDGDATALAAQLDAAVADRQALAAMGAAARRHVSAHWGPREFAAGMAAAVAAAVAHRRRAAP